MHVESRWTKPPNQTGGLDSGWFLRQAVAIPGRHASDRARNHHFAAARLKADLLIAYFCRVLKVSTESIGELHLARCFAFSLE